MEICDETSEKKVTTDQLNRLALNLYSFLYFFFFQYNS